MATYLAVRIHKTGGPGVLSVEDVEVGAPQAGQVLVRNTAIGLNFVDTYFRTGLYPVQLPSVLGQEGAGVVEQVGAGVTDLKAGDRVAYVGPMGAYAERLLRPADRLVKVPDGIDDKTAAAVLLKGLTAWYLVRRTFKVQRGQTVLVHAAAGGVGLLLCQWAKHLGAEVIGTVGVEAKVEVAKKAGCKHVIVTRDEDFTKKVRELTGGEGVPVVYDGVGKDTFMGSLDCLAPMGTMVSYGNASGAVPPFNIGLLSQKGSLYLTRPTLNTYTASTEDLRGAAAELFDLVQRKILKVSIGQTYALKDAAKAHADLEARMTYGSTVLIP